MKQKRQTRQSIRAHLTGYLFASPWLIGIAAFFGFPILASLYYSFTNYNMLSRPEFVGLANYRVILTQDPYFWKALGNTFYFMIFNVPLTIVISVLVGMLLNRKVRGIRVYRTLYYLPNVVSVIAASLIFQWVFEPSFGFLNQFLSLFGVEGPGWLVDAKWSKISLVILSLWTVGGPVLITLAALQDVPKDQYEAATIDGANAFRRFWHVTIPSITPALFFNLIMGLIGAFQYFIPALIMTSGGPVKSTYFIAHEIYEKAILEYRMGYASALSWILVLIVLTITAIVFGTSRRWVHYEV